MNKLHFIKSDYFKDNPPQPHHFNIYFLHKGHDTIGPLNYEEFDNIRNDYSDYTIEIQDNGSFEIVKKQYDEEFVSSKTKLFHDISLSLLIHSDVIKDLYNIFQNEGFDFDEIIDMIVDISKIFKKQYKEL